MPDVRVRVPQVKDVSEALVLYYEKTELSTKDIAQLFGKISESRVYKLKKIARDKMHELNKEVFNSSCVNTSAAFMAWGIDIEDLEKRFHKLSKIKKALG